MHDLGSFAYSRMLCLSKAILKAPSWIHIYISSLIFTHSVWCVLYIYRQKNNRETRDGCRMIVSVLIVMIWFIHNYSVLRRELLATCIMHYIQFTSNIYALIFYYNLKKKADIYEFSCIQKKFGGNHILECIMIMKIIF